MGIFDGILLMSDIDGTFERSVYLAPKGNIDAINYFTKNGGRFCFASGRMADYVNLRGFNRFINAPCALCNGAVIYDCAKDTVLYQNTVPHTVLEIKERIMPHADGLVRFIAPTDTFTESHTDIDVNNIPDNLKDLRPLKQIDVFETAEQALKFEATLKADPFFDDCYICRSWSVGLEILNRDSTKGQALEFIKKHVGARTTVAIGNFGNDLPMIEAADIGVAVANATDDIKEAADLIVCDCLEDAVADLIYELEDMIKKDLV